MRLLLFELTLHASTSEHDGPACVGTNAKDSESRRRVFEVGGRRSAPIGTTTPCARLPS